MSRNRFASRLGRASLLAATSLLITTAALAALPLEVVSSSSESLRLRLETGEPDWEVRELPALGVTRHRPSLSGFVTTGGPLAPQTPGHGAWILVPPGAEPVLEVVSETWRALDGRALLRGAVPVRIPDREGGRDRLGEEYVLPGGTPRTGESVLSTAELASAALKGAAGAVLSLGEVVEWRGRRIAPLTVRPLQAGADGRARRLLQSGEWRIRFQRDTAVRSSGGRMERRDARFASRFLNGDLLSTTPREAAPDRDVVRTRAADKALLAPEVRLPVAATGPVVIEARALINASLLPGSGIPETSLRLYQRRWTADQDPPYVEIEVPILMLGDGGDFVGDDAFLFYGLRPRDDGAFSLGGTDYPGCGDPHEIFNPSNSDPVNNGNIYYLAAVDPEGEPWARMETLSLPAAAGAPEASYRRTDYHEEDTHYGFFPYAHESDRNFWNSYQQYDWVLRDLGLVSPAAGGADARVRVGLAAYGNINRDFDIALTRDEIDTPLGTFSTGLAGGTYDSGAVIPSADLIGSELKVANGVYNRLYGYLDWFEVEYDAAYAAPDDVLEFHAGEGTGARDLEITGFTSDQLVLMDVSDHRAPRQVLLDAANLVDDGGGTTLSLSAEQDAPRARRFLALAGNPVYTLPTFPYFKASRVTYPDDPADAAEAPDVLVITHPTFRSEAERWAEYRAGSWPQDLSIHIADVHAIYDWYSGGLKNPEAIKRFCAEVQSRHGAWALQIFGDANENVKGLSDPHNLRDWVPSRWHCWERGSYQNAMLPSDKWFVNPGAGDDYPKDTISLPEMVVGRFPANSTAEAANLVDKVIAYEAADGDWKKRAVFIADDAWSDGYTSSADEQGYKSLEEDFEETQEIAAANWETFALPGTHGVGDDGFTADRIYLSTDLEPLSPPHNEVRSRSLFRQHCETLCLPRLLSAANQGATFVHYQGHGSGTLLAHEQIVEDIRNSPFYREDADSFDNTGRPWVFVGLGCHIATWALDGSDETDAQGVPSLAEKILQRVNAGAVATYASPGYEFLTPNAALVQLQFQQMLQRPPRGEVAGGDVRSRWVLGELILAAESEFLALSPYDDTYRLAVAQYALLGDGLMIIDTGPPDVDVFLDWEPIADGAELTALDASNELVFTVRAFDEAGVDRLVISDSEGADLSSLAVGGPLPGSESDQRTEWEVRLPIEPRDYSVTFEVYDTNDGPDADAPFRLTAHLPVTVALRYDGRVFVAGETDLPAGADWAFTGTAVAAAHLGADVELDLLGQNVELSGVALSRVDEHEIDLAFTARATGAGTPAVVLTIDGHGTEIPLQTGGSAGDAEGIDSLMAFPNPVHREAHFLFETDASPSPGRILIYTVAGHVVKELPVRAAHFGWGGGRVRVPWDGRDTRGEPLANGVYVYRVVLDAPGGALESGMQRLVVMR